MPTALAIPLFLASLGVTLAAAGSFARRLDRLGLRLGLPEALLGVLTAVAADSPEVTSAVVALVRGDRNVGLGVVLGSNAFNLAAMIGVSALVAGAVRVRREPLLLEGTVGVLATLVVGALIVRWMEPWTAAVLLAVLIAPYLWLLLMGRRVAATRVPFAGKLSLAVGETRRHGHHERIVEHLVWTTELLIAPVVALIVLGSIGMVEAATTLADRWSIPDAVVGTLVLAVLTSIPNAYTGVRLGRTRRGSALMSETLNSNTINLVAGVALPGLVLTLAPLTGLVVFDLAWVLGLTLLTLLFLGTRAGCTRSAGALIVALYAVFVVVQIVASA